MAKRPLEKLLAALDRIKTKPANKYNIEAVT